MPEHQSQPLRRRIQFSLMDLLALSFYAAIVMALYHTSTPDAELGDDVTWIIVISCGAMMGVLVAARRNISGFKRRILIGMSIALWTFFGALHFGNPKYVCWRCLAERKAYGCLIGITSESATSRKVNKLCGQTCSHSSWMNLDRWQNWSIIKGMSEFSAIPLRSRYGEISLVENLDKIPEQSWRCAAIDCIGNPNSKLKFIAAMIVADLHDRCPANSEEWSEWWAVNQKVFVPKFSVQEAMPFAQETVNRLGQLSTGLNAVSEQALWDLPELRIP